MSDSRRPVCPVQNAIIAALGAAATPYCSSLLGLSTQTYTDTVETYITETLTATSEYDGLSTFTAQPTTTLAFVTSTALTCTSGGPYPDRRGLLPVRTIIVTDTLTVCPCAEPTSKEPCSESANHAPSASTDSSFIYSAFETSSSRSGYYGASSYVDSSLYPYVTDSVPVETPTSAPYYPVASNSTVYPGTYSTGAYVYSYGTSVSSYMSSSSSSAYYPAQNSSSSAFGTTAYSHGTSVSTSAPLYSAPSNSSTPVFGTTAYSSGVFSSPIPTPTGFELLTTLGGDALTSACSCLSLDEPYVVVESTTTLTATTETVQFITPVVTTTPTFTSTSTLISTSTTGTCCQATPYYAPDPNPPIGAECGGSYQMLTDSGSLWGFVTAPSLQACKNFALSSGIKAQGVVSFYYDSQGNCGLFKASVATIAPYDAGSKIFYDDSCFVYIDPCATSSSSPAAASFTPAAVSSTTPPTTSSVPTCTSTPYNTDNPNPPADALCGRVFASGYDATYLATTAPAPNSAGCRDIALADGYASFFYTESGMCIFFIVPGSQMTLAFGDDQVFYDTSCFETVNPCAASATTTTTMVTYPTISIVP